MPLPFHSNQSLASAVRCSSLLCHRSAILGSSVHRLCYPLLGNAVPLRFYSKLLLAMPSPMLCHSWPCLCPSLLINSKPLLSNSSRCHAIAVQLAAMPLPFIATPCLCNAAHGFAFAAQGVPSPLRRNHGFALARNASRQASVYLVLNSSGELS